MVYGLLCVLTRALELERKGEVLLPRTLLRVAPRQQRLHDPEHSGCLSRKALLQPETPLLSESLAHCCLFTGVSAPTPPGKEATGVQAGEPVCVGESWPLRVTMGMKMTAM